MLRIPMRAGSLVIWDQRTPHGSHPNNSSNSRFAQFLKVFPAHPIDAKRAANRAAAVREMMSKCGFGKEELTELGISMFGLEAVSKKKKKNK